MPRRRRRVVMMMPEDEIQAEQGSRRRRRRSYHDFAINLRCGLLNHHFLDHHYLVSATGTFNEIDAIAADMNGAIMVMVMRFFRTRVDDFVRSCYEGKRAEEGDYHEFRFIHVCSPFTLIRTQSAAKVNNLAKRKISNRF